MNQWSNESMNVRDRKHGMIAWDDSEIVLKSSSLPKDLPGGDDVFISAEKG
jgi:hypothetical protein